MCHNYFNVLTIGSLNKAKHFGYLENILLTTLTLAGGSNRMQYTKRWHPMRYICTPDVNTYTQLCETLLNFPSKMCNQNDEQFEAYICGWHFHSWNLFRKTTIRDSDKWMIYCITKAKQFMHTHTRSHSHIYTYIVNTTMSVRKQWPWENLNMKRICNVHTINQLSGQHLMEPFAIMWNWNEFGCCEE